MISLSVLTIMEVGSKHGQRSLSHRLGMEDLPEDGYYYESLQFAPRQGDIYRMLLGAGDLAAAEVVLLITPTVFMRAQGSDQCDEGSSRIVVPVTTLALLVRQKANHLPSGFADSARSADSPRKFMYLPGHPAGRFAESLAVLDFPLTVTHRDIQGAELLAQLKPEALRQLQKKLVAFYTDPLPPRHRADFNPPGD